MSGLLELREAHPVPASGRATQPGNHKVLKLRLFFGKAGLSTPPKTASFGCQLTVAKEKKSPSAAPDAGGRLLETRWIAFGARAKDRGRKRGARSPEDLSAEGCWARYDGSQGAHEPWSEGKVVLSTADTQETRVGRTAQVEVSRCAKNTRRSTGSQRRIDRSHSKVSGTRQPPACE